MTTRDALLALGADQLSLWERFLASVGAEPEAIAHIGDSSVDLPAEIDNHSWLERFYHSSNEGMKGRLTCMRIHSGHPIGPPLRLVTIEPPWFENAVNSSCIPTGSYLCTKEETEKDIGGFRFWYLVHDVPGRSEILLHPGNWAGNEVGNYSDSRGCILPGQAHASLRPPGGATCQEAVAESRDACVQLQTYFESEPFTLHISGFGTLNESG